MKHEFKTLIALAFFGFLFLISARATPAQDSIEVRTKECYWVDLWYVGADTIEIVSAHTFQTRYNPILKIWIINNQAKVDYVKSMTMRYEGDNLADIEEVQIWREAANLPNPQSDPWDTSYSYYPSSRRDSLCAARDFDTSGYAYFDLEAEYAQDSTRFELQAYDSVLFYVILTVAEDLPWAHTDNILDVMIPKDSVKTQNGFNAPASNQGEGRTYRVLLDATPPNVTESDIYINVWGDSAAVQLGVNFTDSVVSLTDNVTHLTSQSLDDIQVFADMRSFGTDFFDKKLARCIGTDDFTFSDSIKHEDKQGYGVDIEAYERLAGGGTPGSYIQKVTAWDEFGNGVTAWDLENPKPIDTIWPHFNVMSWFLHYDANNDVIAAIGDSIKLTIDMRFQPPSADYDEIMNKDVYHLFFPRNGVYFADRYDLRGFDPAGIHYTYPFQLCDDDANEIWMLLFEVKFGDWDVPPACLIGYVWVTAEDNANYWPAPPYYLINHVGPGNQRRWKSRLFPFAVDNYPPIITGFTYDFAAGGDFTCPNMVNIGDRLFFIADLRANLDSLSEVTIDLLTNGLGGPADAQLYDDGTHGDSVANDGYYSLDWAITEPDPVWTWDTEFDGVHHCSLTVKDDAGNAATALSYIGRSVDTQLPYPVYELSGQALPDGRIQLSWRDSTNTSDKGYYYIYWNGGIGGIGGIDTIDQCGIAVAPESTWTSAPLTPGLSYCFLIWNMDDACNMEKNMHNTICLAHCQEMALFSGWQWISSYMRPDLLDIESVFADCWSCLDIVVASDGSFCIPGVICNIPSWNVCQTYKVHANNSCILEVCGHRVPVDTAIVLNGGWNCPGYKPDCPLEPDFALASIWECLNIVKNDAGDFCIPGLICTIDCMEPGEGYKVHMACPDTLIYPTSCPSCPPPFAKQAPYSERLTPTHFNHITNTGESYSIVVNSIDLGGKSLEVGDEVAVFTTSGLCVGAGVWQGKLLGISAWADDEQTETIDGFRPGEQIVFKLWDKSENTEIELQAKFEKGEGTFGDGAYALVNLTAKTTPQLPQTFSLSQNYPNPFNPVTEIRYTLPEDCRVKLTLYNIMGQKIRVLVDEHQTAGYKNVRWDGKNNDGSEVASGIYFYQMKAGGIVQQKKMVLMR